MNYRSVYFILAIFVALASTSQADVYMHNPRGSNDRNCERNVNRNNGNRLFDSQNNNNGGYACQRGVGDETFQAEDGSVTFSRIADDDTASEFTQNKRIYYYSGSILPIEWTNQHGCGGNSKVNCEIILQYACEDTLDPQVDNFWPWVNNKNAEDSKYFGKQHFRSGSNIAAPRDGVPIDSNDAATDTINNDEASAIPNTPTTRRYGMHENFDYYTLCQQTERNMGLYTADQLVLRNDRRGTRQNPVGNRHGLECPEERDYYPWWAPSPWIDIAVLTDSGNNDTVCYQGASVCTKRCEYYLNNTMNFHKKGYCDVNHNISTSVTAKLNSRAWNSNRWYNNRGACEANGFVWYEISHADNMQLPNTSFVCGKAQFARVNQLGNAESGYVVSHQNQELVKGVVTTHVSENLNANRFLWTIPSAPNVSKSYFSDITSAYKSCTLRLRYNVSSADFQPWPKDAVDEGASRMVDYHNNSKYAYDPDSPLSQDPYVYIGPGDSPKKGSQFVKLKVNTNQYSRTFQDRSYVFSIKPLPSESADADNAADTPEFDQASVMAAMQKGGKIYNVNVRGKRGNIVQVYPSVEYDFVPNALSLGENDMIHFQWTGSDYNPRRGCNDATGGPPDLNTYSTAANADQNPRADRSNVVFTYHMGYNVPKDYMGYDIHSNLSWAEKTKIANATVLANAPCYKEGQSQDIANQCYNTMMRLAYLNQQSDLGSLTLRDGKKCLTQQELDAIGNQDIEDFHPLNCAKMNAKPYPYFDGGIMFMRNSGWFPFFSSRNNNFSNRQQIGVICVGKDCKVDPATNVLQDKNPMTNGISAVNTNHSACYSSATPGPGQANQNGAHSCLASSNSSTTAQVSILTGETLATQEGDNDNFGDGNKKGCAVKVVNPFAASSVEQDIALAFILLAVGLVFSWAAYYLYNRYQARKNGESKFRYDTAWQKAAPVEKKYRPVSIDRSASSRQNSSDFSGVNIHASSLKRSESARSTSLAANDSGVKMTRPTKSTSGQSPSPERSRGPSKSPKRTEMI